MPCVFPEAVTHNLSLVRQVLLEPEKLYITDGLKEKPDAPYCQTCGVEDTKTPCGVQVYEYNR